jgi:Protein of unknown function (DUF2510)
MTQAPPPAGWYPQGSQERWWDGNAWSDNFRPLGSDQAQQATYQQPGYAQPTYGQPQPYGVEPVQKSHTARNLLIIFGVLFVVLVGGCVAGVAIIGHKVNDAVNDDTLGGPNNPLTITEGQPFEVNGFEYAAGWSIAADPADATVSVNDLKVTNNRGKADRLFAEIKLLSGNEVVATINCDGGGIDKISKGTTITVNCYSSDSVPAAYDKVTIQDAF